MLKGNLIHPELMAALSQCGHGDKVLIADGNYPLASRSGDARKIYLGLTPGDCPAAPPYLRPLAANASGRRLLARMRETASAPVLTKPAAVRRLGPEARALFDLEVRAADLYALAYPALAAAGGGSAWKEGPVLC